MSNNTKKLKSLWMKNTAGVPSLSTTFAVTAFVVTTAVYVASIFEQIGPVTLRPFDAAACGAYLTPVLTLYFSRRYTESKFPTTTPLSPEPPEGEQT